MSTFPRGFGGSAAAIDPSSFHPLFRFLDDFDNYNQHTTTKDHRGHSLRTFNPKFDVKETPANYELYGELPGIEEKDVEIEFTEGQTLVIHGRTERSYTEGIHPASLSIEDKKGKQDESQHQPRVEDDNEEDGARKLEKSGNGNTSTTATRYKEAPQHQQPQAKYWVSERSIGEFSRSFNFPDNVDRDAVTASMKNGILSVIVPKAKKAGGRKIQITS